jgi:FkbM family methyltransferase
MQRLFFDIGANIGNWSNANIDKCDRIFSIEASPSTFERLVNNRRDYRIIPLNYAVCNNNNGDDITFYQATCDAISTINKDWLTSESSRFCNHPYTEIKCKTITIDKLIKQCGVPELIKIDVEGGEYECISSLTQKVKNLCFEWASETNDTTFKCIEHLRSLGFTEYYMQKEDNYTFTPSDADYYDIDTIKDKLRNTVKKVDWGMIWCK